jgi:hypothetical protein
MASPELLLVEGLVEAEPEIAEVGVDTPEVEGTLLAEEALLKAGDPAVADAGGLAPVLLGLRTLTG